MINITTMDGEKVIWQAASSLGDRLFGTCRERIESVKDHASSVKWECGNELCCYEI